MQWTSVLSPPEKKCVEKRMHKQIIQESWTHTITEFSKSRLGLSLADKTETNRAALTPGCSTSVYHNSITTVLQMLCRRQLLRTWEASPMPYWAITYYTNITFTIHMPTRAMAFSSWLTRNNCLYSPLSPSFYFFFFFFLSVCVLPCFMVISMLREKEI